MLAWTKDPAPFPLAFDGSERLGIEVLENTRVVLPLP